MLISSIPLLLIFLLHSRAARGSNTACETSTAFPFSPDFDIQSVTTLAQSLPSHSWEYGTTAEALLELYNPAHSVFGDTPFPVPTLPKETTKPLSYAAGRITFGTRSDGLVNGNGAVGDPASLGVSAVLLGKSEAKYMEAAKQTMGYLVGSARRQRNGAISHRRDVTELWADFIYMAPPFLAYYAAHTSNNTLLLESVNQCRWYRQTLRANTTASYKGTWHHIIGPQSPDWGLWSTGNAWAAAGMARVLATVLKSPSQPSWRDKAVKDLNWYIREIIEGAMGSHMSNGLVRNYMNDVNGPGGFGEVAGSALLAATTYRMMVLRPQTFADPKYVNWADGIRKTLGALDGAGRPHVTAGGVVTPAVNPLNWKDTTPVRTGSPEAQAFTVLMYAAWRDCVLKKICKRV